MVTATTTRAAVKRCLLVMKSSSVLSTPSSSRSLASFVSSTTNDRIRGTSKNDFSLQQQHPLASSKQCNSSIRHNNKNSYYYSTSTRTKQTAAAASAASSRSSTSQQGDYTNSSNNNEGGGSSSSSITTSNEDYVSPFEEFLSRMERNGPTTLDMAGATAANATTTTESSKNATKILQCGIPETALRFSTTSYGRTMNEPYVHPTEHRVIMKVNTNLISTNVVERELLRSVVGHNRWNDERNELRLMSDQFGSRIENKRHLVHILDRIVLSCQRLAKEIDINNYQEEQDNNKSSSNENNEEEAA